MSQSIRPARLASRKNLLPPKERHARTSAGEVMGVEVDTIKSRVFRAREALDHMLQRGALMHVLAWGLVTRSGGHAKPGSRRAHPLASMLVVVLPRSCRGLPTPWRLELV